MADDLGKQVELQNELNKLLKDSIGLLKQQGRLMSQQAGYAKDMSDSLQQANLGDLQGQTEKLTQGLDQAADSAQSAGNKMSQAANQSSIALQGLVDKGPKIGLLAGAFRGVVGAVKGTFETFKSLGSIIAGTVSTFAKLGQTIIMLPFKMMTGLIKMSQKGGVDPLRVALEAVRGEMGNLATNEGKMLADSVKDLRGQMGNMAGTGLSMARVFGYGREGLATFLKENLELSKAVGIGFGNLRGEFEKNAVSLAMYRKGLGLTAEQQGIQLKVAKARGLSIKDETRAFASMAINMGKTFGVNAKVVGKAMAEMQSDVSNFGHMSKKQLGASATYAAKLGIEVKDLMNVFNKFDNFENAAKGAAELAQTFGMNVDAMALLSAESPAEQVDMLRKSFFDTGKTLKDLNRHERKLLETQTGLTGAALESAFANENMGMSYADIEAGAEDAEKKQLTQAEAMQELGKSIEKLTKSGAHGFNSFFDAFLGGFTKGIERSKVFRKLMRNLQRSMRVIYRAGIKVGKMFVQMFPGVKDVLKGLAKMFDPKRFKILARGLVKTFKTFFKDMQADPQKAVKKLIDNLAGVFKKHLGTGGSALMQVKKGFMNFFRAIGGIVAGLIPIIKEKLAEALEGLVNVLANPDVFKSGAKEMGKGAGGFIMEVFGPIIESLRGNKELNARLTKALGDLWDMFVASAWPIIKDGIWFLFKLALGKAVIFSAFSAAGGWIVGAVPKLFKRLVFGKETAKALAEGSEQVVKKSGMFSKMATGMGKAGRGASKAIGKVSAKVVARGFSMGLKSVPMIGTAAAFVLDAGLAFSDAADRYGKTGSMAEAGKAFTSSFVSGLTFGLVEADVIENWAYGTASKAQMLTEKVEKMAVKRTAEFMKSSAAAIKGHQKDVDAIMTGLRGSAKDMADVIDSLGPEVTAKGKAALKSAGATIMKMQTAHAKHRKDLDVFKAQEARKAGSFAAALENMKSQDADDALELGVTRDNKFMSALKKARVSYNVVDGVIEIAKKDREAALKLFADLGDGSQVAARAAGRATLDQTLRTQKILATASTESLKSAISLHERAGKDATELRKQLTTKIEQASMLAALKKADPAKFQRTSATNTDIKKAYEDYKKSLATSTDAAAQQKLLDIQKEVDADLKKHLPDIADKMKLEKLEAAESTLRQLEALKHVPRRLAVVKKSIAGIKLKAVEEEVRIVFDKMAGIASILNDQADREEFKQLRVTAVDELMNFDTLASSTKDTVVTINTMLKAIGNLPSSTKVDVLMDGLKNAYGAVIKFGRNVIGDRTTVSAIVPPLEELKGVIFGLTQLDKIMASPLLSDPDKAAAIVKSVQTMKGLLTPMVDTVAEVQAFSGGNLTVTHNLPNTQIKLQVNIDSKQLGKAIAVTNIGKDTAKGKAYMATQPLPAAVEG